MNSAILAVLSQILAILFLCIIISVLIFRRKRKPSGRMMDLREAPETMPAIRYCADCGKQINPRAEICPHCGVRQRLAPQFSDLRYRPNRIIAGLLAILILGGFGAHKFYMGQSGKGLLYLFTSWLFIPFFVAFFEGIRYLLMSDEHFEKEYWH